MQSCCTTVVVVQSTTGQELAARVVVRCVKKGARVPTIVFFFCDAGDGCQRQREKLAVRCGTVEIGAGIGTRHTGVVGLIFFLDSWENLKGCSLLCTMMCNGSIHFLRAQ